MNNTRITQKGQATIPAEVRAFLGLKTGDLVGFEIEGGKVTVKKARPFDKAYHDALSAAFSEWDNEADDEAYNDL